MHLIKHIQKKRYKDNLYGEKVEVKETKSLFPEDYDEENERRMDIIGQNGNDGEHYDELDINKDGVVSQDEIEIAKQKIKDLKTKMTSSVSSWRRNKISSEIKNIKDNLDDEDTKIY